MAHRVPHVVVYILGADGAALAVLVDVLEQLVARQLAAAPYDACRARIVHVDRVRLARLALELEAHGRAAHLDVLRVHRGQTVRAVVARVLVVPDADQRLVEQPDDGRDHLLARQPRQRHVGEDLLAQGGHRFGEIDQTPVLRFVARLAPLLVVAVLLAPARVASGRLQVTALARTDPHVGPRGRDGQRTDARERLVVAHRSVVGVHVREPAAARDAADARRGVADVPQPCRARRVELFLVDRHGAARDTRPKTP